MMSSSPADGVEADRYVFGRHHLEGHHGSRISLSTRSSTLDALLQEAHLLPSSPSPQPRSHL